jgi:hypothetical protein
MVHPTLAAKSASPGNPFTTNLLFPANHLRFKNPSPALSFKWDWIPNPMPLSSRTTSHSALTVGRTPWSEADAPFGPLPVVYRCSPLASSRFRGTRADQGVRPASYAGTPILRIGFVSHFSSADDFCPGLTGHAPGRDRGARPPRRTGLGSFRTLIDQPFPPTVTGRARNRPPRPWPQTPDLCSLTRCNLQHPRRFSPHLIQPADSMRDYRNCQQLPVVNFNMPSGRQKHLFLLA